MATNTTNYGLTKPAYSDTADIADINGNMDTVDSEMTKLSNSVAVVEFGDTATQAISNGTYVVWKGNLYKANQAISSGATLSGKLTAVSGGGLNDVYSSLNSNLGVITTDVNSSGTSVASATWVTIKTLELTAGVYVITGDLSFTSNEAGIRILLIDVTENSSNAYDNSVLASGRSDLNKTRIISLNATTTIYLRAYQTSGNSLTVKGKISAVKFKV